MGRVCPVPLRKTRIVQSSNSKQIFSLALRPETKCHISRLFLWKKLSQCGSACVAYARAGYSIIKMKKKRKNISLFKLKKKIEFFSLALRPETKCHISRFFLWKKLSQCGRARVAYARAGYSIIKMKKKRKNISLFKLKKKIEFFSLALRPETKCHISNYLQLAKKN